MLAAGIPLVQAFEIVGVGHDKPADAEADPRHQGRHRGRHLAARGAGQAPAATSTTCSSTWSRPASRRARSRSLLDKIATYKEKTEALKKKIKKALFYPAAVLVVAVIVTVILLIFVIPQFEALFKGFGADLPAFTQMVIDMSQLRAGQGLVCIGIVLGGGVVRSSTSRSARARCGSSSTA